MPASANQSSADPRAKLLQSLSEKSRDRLLGVLNEPGWGGQIPAAAVQELVKAEGKTADALMAELLALAQAYARPPISNFRVGAVARGSSGSLYLGANLEIPGQALGFCVHAEQAALSNAYMHSEPGISSLALTAPPCGHCRQFMKELAPDGGIQLLVGHHPPMNLSFLLPMAFGPIDLGLRRGALPVREAELALPQDTSDDLASAALDAARRSYAPYSKAPAGIAAATERGGIYKGAYIENAAFNPSLPPLETALVALVLAGEDSQNISKVLLVEVEGASISQKSITEVVLRALAPAAELRVVKATLRV
jgi:cytidine deaminase